jgi:hypothetical protein
MLRDKPISGALVSKAAKKGQSVETAKNPAAVALGRQGGLKGGKARAKALSGEERSEAARHAARTRWRRQKETEMAVSFEVAQDHKPRAVEVLLKKYPEVSGVGVTRVGDGWGFKVNLSKPARRQLPRSFEGVPISTEIVGDVLAL